MEMDAAKWRVLKLLLGIALVLLVGLGVWVWLEGNRAGGAALLGGAVFLAPAYVLRERVGSPLVIGNYLAAVLFCILAILSFVRGGLNSTITQWMTLIPLGASLLGRARVALVWCAAATVMLAALASLEATGMAPPPSTPSLIVRWVSQVILMGLALWLVQRVRKTSQAQQEQFSRRAMAGQKLESLGRLAGGIAHDFNNVLAVVLARVDDAMHRLEPTDPQFAELRAIRTAAKRGASLASELVAFSRRGPATYDVLRPVDIVRDVQQVIARLVRENVQVDIVVDDDVPPVEGDRDHLLQVLLNLAINAQDAMPTGGRMRLELRAERVDHELEAATGLVAPGQYAVVCVTDEGVGMSKETLARIFEPFFTTKDRGRGSGIGLATVHAIINQHGGQLRVSSALGVGSTFEVYLPLTSRSGELTETTDDLRAHPGATSLRVLLVEDDDLVRRALEVMLSRAGHRVVAAANGAEALTRWEESTESFDTVLTDVLMPGMTGPDLVRQLRDLEPTLRVVYMSGHVDDAMRDVSLEKENALFVRKPASRAALLSALEQVVAKGAGVPTSVSGHIEGSQ
ncbi:MAG: ATP-binding protein [Myxococcota bacterium]